MSGPAPVVSCLVPVYNGARFLAEAIHSILSQDWRPIEVIVVDDGSTDATPEILAGFGDQITVIRQENAGPVVARNRAIAAAAGEFLAFLDGDDLWAPKKLSRQVARLLAEPALGFCVAQVQNFWEAEVADEGERLGQSTRAQPIVGYVTGTLVVRRAVAGQVGPFDVALAHGDSADWFMRAEQLGVKGVCLDEVLLHRRLHRENRSRLRAQGSRDEFLRLLKRAVERNRSAPPPPPEPPT